MTNCRVVDSNVNLEDIPGYGDPLRRRLHALYLNSWAFRFRKVVLPALPGEKIAEAYSRANGRSDKDLLTMTGLMVLQEVFDLSDAEALEKLLFDGLYHVALGLRSFTEETFLDAGTYGDFRRRLMATGMYDELFSGDTLRVIGDFQDFLAARGEAPASLATGEAPTAASMAAVVAKFLRALGKTAPEAFDGLDPALVEAYLPSAGNGAEPGGPDPAARRPASTKEAALDIGAFLIMSESHPAVRETDEFKALAKVFGRQSEVWRRGDELITFKDYDDELKRKTEAMWREILDDEDEPEDQEGNGDDTGPEGRSG